MEVGESRYWVGGISQVPNLKGRCLIIIVGGQELSGDLGIPNDISFSWRRGRFLAAIGSFTPKVVEIVILLVGIEAWLSELEDRLARLQVPDTDFAVLGCRCQDMGDHPVPAD